MLKQGEEPLTCPRGHIPSPSHTPPRAMAQRGLPKPPAPIEAPGAGLPWAEGSFLPCRQQPCPHFAQAAPWCRCRAAEGPRGSAGREQPGTVRGTHGDAGSAAKAGAVSPALRRECVTDLNMSQRTEISSRQHPRDLQSLLITVKKVKPSRHRAHA